MTPFVNPAKRGLKRLARSVTSATELTLSSVSRLWRPDGAFESMSYLLLSSDWTN